MYSDRLTACQRLLAPADALLVNPHDLASQADIAQVLALVASHRVIKHEVERPLIPQSDSPRPVGEGAPSVRGHALDRRAVQAASSVVSRSCEWYRPVLPQSAGERRLTSVESVITASVGRR